MHVMNQSATAAHRMVTKENGENKNLSIKESTLGYTCPSTGTGYTSEPILDKARKMIAGNLCSMVELGTLDNGDIDRVIDNIEFTTDLASCLSGAKYVLKALSENLEIKRFKPPKILSDMVRDGQRGLKNLKGFYVYASESGDKVRRKRGRMLYRRLEMYRNEQETKKE